MKKIFIILLILGFFSGFSEGKESFNINKLNVNEYTIEITDKDCRGLTIQLRKDKLLEDWAYNIIKNHETVDPSSFGEEKFISCVIKSIKNSSDIIKGTHQIRIRFRLEFLNGIFSNNGKTRKSLALLKGTIKEKDSSIVKFLSPEIESYSTIISFCNSMSDLDFFCKDYLVGMEPPRFETKLLGLKKSHLATLEHFGLPKEFGISLSLSSKSKRIGMMKEQPVSK